MGNTICLFYFSGTGNTEITVHRLAAHLEEAAGKEIRLLPAEKAVREGLPEDARAIGFAFPVYDFHAPRIISDLVKKLPIILL